MANRYTDFPRLGSILQKDSVRQAVLEFGFLIVAVLQMLTFWFKKHHLNARIAGDVTKVWRPFADAVLQGGAPYLAQWDNKPPVFHFLNISFAATDHYLLAFFLTMGVANGITAILIHRYCRQHNHARIGLVAAGIFISILPLASFQVDPRPYANVVMLVALITSRGLVSGVSIAVAGLLSQFSILLIPVIVWQQYQQRKLTWRWLSAFVFSGLVTVIVTFGLVASIWTPDAAITGFKYSFLESGKYVNHYADMNVNLFGAPIPWVWKEYQLLDGVSSVIFGAIVGTIAIWKTDHYDAGGFGQAMIAGFVLLLFQTTIRTSADYTTAWLPFAAVLTAIGLKFSLKNSDL